MMKSSSKAIIPEPSPAEIEIAKWKPLIKKHDVCRMHIKKYKVTKKTDTDKLLHRTNVEKSVFYKTEGRISTKNPKIRDKFGYELIFNDTNKSELSKYQSTESGSIPKYILEHLHEQQDGSKKSSIRGKYTYSCTASNIRDRLFIPEKYEESFKGITDVDEKYFSIVQERREKSKLCKNKYIGYLRDSLRLRLQTGYIYDEIYKIKEQSEIEKNKLDGIKLSLKEYKLAFDEYLAEDHNESMFPLLLYAKDVAETEYKRDILSDKLLEVSKISYKIYSLEESWQNCKRCEEFILSFFSILSGNNSSYYLEMKYGPNCDLSDSEQPSSEESTTSLIQFTVPKVINDNLGINLEDPSYLLEIFKSLEHQCLDYLSFTELLEQPNKVISLHLDLITRMFETEIGYYQQNLLKINNIITFTEQNNEHLKSHLHTLLNGIFKESFDGAEESIIINEYVKQTYNKCISGSDSYVSTDFMMTSLAFEYKTLLLEMDDLPTGLLRNVVRTVEHRENMRLAVAVDARRRLNELKNLTEQMSRSFDPVNINKGRKLMFRSAPMTEPEKLLLTRDITEEEKEYLHYFTEYCQYTDDPKEYISKEKPF